MLAHIFPPLGLGGSESASITVVNSASAASVLGSANALAPSCSGTISFLNAAGQIGTPVSFTVGEEQFKTVVLPFANAGLGGAALANGNRGEIQGRVFLTGSAPPATPCSLTLSMEVYDSASGVTHTVLTGLLTRFGPVIPVSPGGVVPDSLPFMAPRD